MHCWRASAPWRGAAGGRGRRRVADRPGARVDGAECHGPVATPPPEAMRPRPPPHCRFCTGRHGAREGGRGGTGRAIEGGVSRRGPMPEPHASGRGPGSRRAGHGGGHPRPLPRARPCRPPRCPATRRATTCRCPRRPRARPGRETGEGLPIRVLTRRKETSGTWQVMPRHATVRGPSFPTTGTPVKPVKKEDL